MADTPLFSLHLLGPFMAQRHDGGPKPNLSRKTRAMLAYLAATDEAHSRRALYEMFCADSQDPAGALRWHLSRMRRMLGPESLLVEDNFVRFNTTAGWVDCLQFDHVLAQESNGLELAELNRTLAYYKGDFLAELHIQGAANFEFWLLSERSRYQQIYERGLRGAIKRNIEAGQYDEGLNQAQRLLQTNPLSEEGHAFLMQLYALTGRRDAAMTQFEHCRQLLATDLAVEPSRELFALRERIELGEVGAWNRPVLSLVDLPAVSLASAHDLVGRETELDLLRQAYQAGQMVIVAGVAGVGKSALVEAFARQMRGVKLLRGDCYESTTAMPYRPWIDIIEQILEWQGDREWGSSQRYWLDQLATISPALAALRDNEGFQMPAATSQQHLFTAFAELVARLEEAPPLLLFIDDLQWADDTSMQLLQFMAQRLGRERGNHITLVATYRSEELGDNPLLPMVLRDLSRATDLLEIDLQPLDLVAVDELISQIWPELPLGFRTPHVRDRLWEATAGNPLFLSEILRELAGKQTLPDEVPIPPGLQELVARRLSQLADSGRQVAEALAILEQPSAFDLIQRVSGRSEDEVAAALDAALRWHLVRTLPESPAGHYDFNHDLLRSAVKGRMSDVRRRLLHRRTAETLARQAGPAAAIAYHWQQAGVRDQEMAWWQKAGVEAAEIYANTDAERYFTRARKLSDDALVQAEIDWHLATVMLVSSRWQEAQGLLASAEKVARSAAAPYLLGRIRQRQGNLLVQQGRYDEALPPFAEAKKLFAATNRLAEQAEIAGSLGSIFWRRADYEAALAAHEQKLEIAEELHDLRQQSEALGGIAAILNQSGKYEEALVMHQKALELAQQANDPLRVGKIKGNMGITYARLLDYATAIDHFRAQFESDRALGDDAGVANSIGNMGTVYRMFGHFSLARACGKLRLRVAMKLEDRRGLAVALGDLGATYLDEGRPDEALPLLAQAIILAEYLEDPFLLCSYLHFQSQCWQQKEAYEKAATLMDRALHLAEKVNRLDVLWLARIFQVKFHYDAGQISRPVALERLEAQLRDAEHPRIVARLKYELWRLDNSLDNYRKEASTSYQQAFARAPEHMLRLPLQELLGEELPGSLQLPPLPNELFAEAIGLSEMLAALSEQLPHLLNPG